MHYVYILKCSDKKTYIRCTNDLKVRLRHHHNGYVKSTKARLPIDLINYIAFKDKEKAFLFEKYLKSGSGKAFSIKHFL